jgi:20S proteasome alpha/beta subunit
MTVGIGIKCSDGIVIACDSLATYSRGVPVLRYTNKVDILKHNNLENEVAVISAGMTTYFDKFRDRACRRAIDEASKRSGGKLDIVDFSEVVCEPIMTALLKEYAIDRAKFLGAPIVDFSLSLIIAGATHDKELRAYFVHTNGVSEPLEQYGTIGSGAAYAELFLRFLLIEPKLSVLRAGELAIYAIKGVELMDPNVGGETNVKLVTLDKNRLSIKDLPDDNKPKDPRGRMEGVLQNISKGIEELVGKEERHA